MSGLVRAKRLVFVQVKIGISLTNTWRAATNNSAYEIWDHAGQWNWECLHPPRNIVSCGTTTSRELAESACQAHFDAAWLEDTEVVPLVWVGNEATVDGGNYHIWDESDEDGDDWAAEFDGDDHWWENYDSRDGAVAACESHNYQRLLGRESK